MDTDAILMDRLVYFINNAKEYEPDYDDGYAGKTKLHDHIEQTIRDSLSPLVMDIFSKRLKNAKKPEKSDKVIYDFYEYLMLAIKINTGVHWEIDGFRYISEGQQKKKKVVS